MSTFPLTHVQQGMLFHHLAGGEPGVDLEQIVCELDEAVDAEALRTAWQLVTETHPALRLEFLWTDSEVPAQRYVDHYGLPWTFEDWTDRTAPEEDFTALLAADRQAGFDLARAPLVRLRLIRWAKDHYRLLWSFPHLIADGRSFHVLLCDVFERYDRIRRGEPSLAKPPESTFRRFAEWLDARDWSQELAAWRGRLRGLRAPTSLPYDRAVPASGHQTRRLRLTSDETAALSEFAAHSEVTLNTLVQAAWARVLMVHSGSDDVLFGATRAGRYGTVDGSADAVGVFINTVPVRVAFGAPSLREDVQALRQQHIETRALEHTPLVLVQTVTELPKGAPAFDSVVVFDHLSLGARMRAKGPAFQARDFQLIERTGFPLTLYGYGGTELQLELSFKVPRFDPHDMARLLDQLATALRGLPASAERPAREWSVLSAAARAEVLHTWNRTERYVEPHCVHSAFAARAARHPQKLAVADADTEVTFGELEVRANRLARHLRARGVGRGSLVGLALGRSVELLVGMLAIQKAGGAYVPLDPEYPSERLAWMIGDSGLQVVVTETAIADELPPGGWQPLEIDRERPLIAGYSAEAVEVGSQPDDLAYVIYTSGSTGRPKGVMVEHRNVTSFFAGMDDRVGLAEDAPLLSVTSLSFDISVLELLWTVCRGRTVVIFSEPAPSRAPAEPMGVPRSIDFGLFYFSSDEDADADTYRLLLDGARFADQHGFSSVWTPERHFHAFGGQFPNPAVVGAALAAVTERVAIRAGSVVLPLHHPVRVAEEWAVVDNLSQGRVGISVASGWQPNDFVLAPEHHASRHRRMYEALDTVQALWRGDPVSLPGPRGPVSVATRPRPVQPELPVWITAAGNPRTFESAGTRGCGILTHLLGQTVESLSENLERYRAARHAAGHQGPGHVTVMLHTFVGDDVESVRETVRGPMKRYLRSAVGLLKGVATEWSAYSRVAATRVDGAGDEFDQLPSEELDALLDFAFERYFETSGLFGTPETCRTMVERLKAIGVTEIGCLIDFGVPTDTALEHLAHLHRLKELAGPAPVPDEEWRTLTAQIARYGVRAMQCTPSLATMLLAAPETRPALGALEQLLVGGEAFPAELARRLRAHSSAAIVNMYGPTETTIWSSTRRVTPAEEPVRLGRPIANTRFYVLDERLQPVPVGVVGELFIGGDGVVRGYHERPELTSERFLADPFAGGRMYRTGDLVRHRSDGSLEFLGRSDHQVKIRGHRIEVGEIESVLGRHSGIAQAVVATRPGPGGDPMLVAWVVHEGPPVDSAVLRKWLGERLPAVMVPSLIAPLETLPLTPNRKVDRNALPTPERGATASSEGSLSPATDIEVRIASVWSELLDLAHVGRRDSFFDLGGHSLLAVQARVRLQAEFGVEVSLMDLFRYPTVETLAVKLGAEPPDAPGPGPSRAEKRRHAMARRRQRRR